jgi:hypothetical protein
MTSHLPEDRGGPEPAEQKQRVEALLIEGLDSGASSPMTPEDWDGIEREGQRIIAARKARKARCEEEE